MKSMTAKTLREIRHNTVLKKRLAKVMALHCFRNTKLECLHAGISPSSKTGDFNDVKVVSPYGEIPWTEVSRFNDDEMKDLMIDVVNHCYDFLLVLFNDIKGNDIIELLKTTDVKKNWQDPTVIAN
jgi:ligand-binding SRPBCC domain-containing protein